MDKLQILLFGFPEVLWKGTPYSIARRTARALLFYLASHEKPVPRSELMLTFWPDEDDHTARANLRDLLGKLRASLPEPDFILSNLETVSLNYDRVDVDILKFIQLTQAIGRVPWQIPSQQPLPENLYHSMVEAVDLWREPSFMSRVNIPDSSQLDAWMTQTEQNLLTQRSNIIQRLISHCEITGDTLSGIRWIKLALEGDQYNEDLHRKLMESLILSGSRIEAIHHGQHVIQLFQKDLGEQPSVELVALIQAIQKETRKNELDQIHLTKAITGLVTKFVGRNDEIHQMMTADAQGKIVLVRGETGIGKTRLVYEYFRRSTISYQMAVASCQASTRSIPYRPFLSMIKEDIRVEELTKLPVEYRRQLFSLDSSIAAAMNEEGTSATQGELSDPSRIEEAFSLYFQALSTKTRILFLLDDAQWIDDASINLIKTLLIKKIIPSRVFLVITCDNAKQNSSLSELIEQLSESRQYQKIDLSHFSRDEVEELVDSVVDPSSRSDILENLYEDTNGNPLMVIETLRSVLYTGFAGTGAAQRKVIPGSIRVILRERLNHLTTQQRQILCVGAIAGMRVPIELLEAVSQLSSDEIVDGLEELEKLGILYVAEDIPQHGISYQFVQNIFREVVLLEMSAARKRLLHRRIARFIEKSGMQQKDVIAAILAEHYTESGDMVGALKAWLDAASYSRRLSSAQDAQRAFLEAEKIFPSIEVQLSDREILQFYRPWGVMAYQNQDIATLGRVVDSLYQVGSSRSSGLLLGVSLCMQGMYRFATHQYPEGLSSTEQALRYLQESGARVDWLECMARKSKFLYMLSRIDEACQVLEEAIGTLPDNPEGEMISAAALLYYDFSTVLTLQGYPARGLEMAGKSLQLYIQAQDLEGQAKVFGQMVLSNVYCCANVRAEQEAAIGLDLAHKIGYKRVEAYILIYQSIARVARGKMDEAWFTAQHALELSRQYPFPEISSAVLRTSGDVYRYLADYPKAIEYYRKGYEVQGDSIVKFDHLARCGYLTGLTGNIDQGLKMLDEAYRSSAAHSLGSTRISARLYQYMLLNSYENLEKASGELRRLLKECSTRKLYTQWCVTNCLLSRLDYLRGDDETGTARLENTFQKGYEMDGLWPQILYQLILCDPPGTIRYDVFRRWKGEVWERLSELEANCISEVTRPAFQAFKNTIDKLE